jgi:hypothetical protein
MLPASAKSAGQCITTGPLDVCKTPAPPAPAPVPIPYPNIGMCGQASGCADKVKICGSSCITTKSEIPMSTGDEPGVAGGIISNEFKGKITWKKGSSKVKAEGNAVAHVTAMTAHNGSNANTVGLNAVPSQVKVLVAM